MKISNESNYKAYGNNYAIITDNGVQTGIFFRFPVRRVCYELYPMAGSFPSLIEWVERCKESRLFRIFNYLLGNGKIVRNALEDIDFLSDDNLVGIEINRIISPIYFRRNYRSLNIINMDDFGIIEYITSFGYDDEWIQTAGYCNKEVTKIHHKYKRTETKLRTGKRYLYTYEHAAQELIKTIEARCIKNKTIEPWV